MIPVPVGITPLLVVVRAIFPPRPHDHDPFAARVASTNSQYSPVSGQSISITFHRFAGVVVPAGIGTESAHPVPAELLPPVVVVVTRTRGVVAVAVRIRGASS